MVTSLTRRLKPSTRSWLLDGSIAVGLTAAAWWMLAFGSRMRGPRPGPVPGEWFHAPVAQPGVLVYLLAAAALLPLIARRRYPLTVLGIVSVAAAAFEFSTHEPVPVIIGPLLALYTVGSLEERPRLAIAGSASAVVLLSTSLPAPTSAVFWTDVVRMVSMLLAAAFIGDATRNRRAYVVEVEQRALEAERTREEEAARRVGEERLRIARELHDVTAHSLSLIAVQSGAALHVIDSKPEEARKALGTIRETSRSSLGELRAMLGVLRGSGDGEAPYAPVPGLRRLADLTEPLRQAGLDVTLHVDGDLAALPAVVDASAYRVIQEALTNVLRHAGRASVDVRVTVAAAVLAIEITDDGRGGSMEASGAGSHGIAGMRERVAALNGEFEAGPGVSGGWRVRATFPLGGAV